MDILIIASLIIGAVILFLVELFVIPGISVAGFLAGGCIIFANYYAFAYMGTTAGVITLIISALACIGSLVWFMRSKTVDRLSLKQTLDYKPEPLKGINIQAGDTGMSLTRLTLIHKVMACLILSIRSRIIRFMHMSGLKKANGANWPTWQMNYYSI